MLVSDFIIEVNDTLRGTDDDAPVSGTDDYDYWLRVANRIRRNLYNDAKKSWAACYDVLSVGTITAATQPLFPLELDLINPADPPYIITTAGSRVDLEIVKPQETNPLRQRQVFIAGLQPQTLFFSRPILVGDTTIGGTLYLPGYFMPTDMASSTDTVVIDDPDWLAVATAAKIAFNDITYEDKSSDLNAEANSLYTQMTDKNRKGVYGRPRITPTNLTDRISAPNRRGR